MARAQSTTDDNTIRRPAEDRGGGDSGLLRLGVVETSDENTLTLLDHGKPDDGPGSGGKFLSKHQAAR